jgi:hypothetical protein
MTNYKKFTPTLFTLSIFVAFIVLFSTNFFSQTTITTTDALVTTMINATTTEIQEQWLIYHMLSAYGPQEDFNLTHVPIIPTQPTLCQDDERYDFNNKIVLVQRGDCPFFQKTFLAQKYNASGVIVGNVDDGPLIMMSYDQKVNTTEITIPSALIRKSPFDYIVNMAKYMKPYPETFWDGTMNYLSQFVKKDENKGSHGWFSIVSNDDDDDDHDDDDGNPNEIITRVTRRKRVLQPFPEENKSHLFDDGAVLMTDNQFETGAMYTTTTTNSGNVRVQVNQDHDPNFFNFFDEKTPNEHNTVEDVMSSALSSHMYSALFGTDPLFPIVTKTTIKPTQNQESSIHASSLTGPFDPTDPDAGPFYFLLTMDQRGESWYPYFPMGQLQFLLIALILAPTVWLIFLSTRWCRLAWGFRCVEELVTNTASHLPICVYIQTNEKGDIIFDSGEGTAGNNMADMMRMAQEQSSSPNYGSVDDSNSLNTETKHPSPIQTTSSMSTLFSTTPSFNSKHNRNVVVAPTAQLYELLKSMPTVSNNYVNTVLASPDFQPNDQSKHLVFKTKTSESSDTKDMTYIAVSHQPIHSLEPKTHFRVHSDTCNICLEPLITGDAVKALGCFHCFHVGCIDRFFNSRGNGLNLDQADQEARAEQRRLYTMMYLSSSYNFDELGGEDAANGTETGTGSSAHHHMGQSCPVCRKSILQTARINAVIRKKWWIKLFEWMCLCSCCCGRQRRELTRARRELERQHGRVIVDPEEDQANYRYSYEVSQARRNAHNNNRTGAETRRGSSPSRNAPPTREVNEASYNPNDYSY